MNVALVLHLPYIFDRSRFDRFAGSRTDLIRNYSRLRLEGLNHCSSEILPIFVLQFIAQSRASFFSRLNEPNFVGISKISSI